MRGEGKFLVRPGFQMQLLVPGSICLMVMGAATIAMIFLVRFIALGYMVRSDLPPSALNHFVASADQCLVLAAVFSGLMIATYWLAMCLVGRSLIGPVVRLEQHITRTCEGISVDRLQVRKKDYLYRAVSLIDQLLESRRQPPVPGEGGAAGCLH